MSATFASPRFIGREREIGRLAEALEAAAAGRPTTLLLSAAGGLGASRLLDETERRIERLPDPLTVVRCRAHPGRSGDPYAPVARALDRLLGATPDADLGTVLGPGAEEIARLLPTLRDRIAGLDLLPARPTITDPERRQTRILEAVLGLLTRLGERRPLLLTIEDLHAADEGTRALAAFLARVSRSGRFTVVATYDPDELTRAHPLHWTLGRMLDVARPPVRLSLEPLGRDELARLIEAIEGDRPSASVLLLVAERSRGNPLVAEELLASRRDRSSISLTGSLDELVIARLADRTPECRRFLRLLAPADEPLRLAQLAAASVAFERDADRPAPRSSTAPRRAGGILEADLASGLDEALEHGFVRIVDDEGRPIDADGPAAETSLAIRHPLIARAVAADLLPSHRRRVHAALAEGLVGRPGAQARHWLAAHVPGRARDASIEAAAQAEASDAPGAALAHLELALEIDDRTLPPGGAADPAAPARLLARAAEAAFGDARTARAVAYAESAIARLDERRDRLELAGLYERLGRFRRALGDREGALAAHRRAVEVVPPGAIRERALVLASLAQVRMLEGTFGEAEDLARQAIEVARAVGPAARGEEGHAMCTLGITRAWGDDPESGIALLEEARAIAESLGRADDLFRATANLTTALDLIGRRNEAVAVALAGIEAARRSGQEAADGNLLRGNGADSLFLLGRWDESLELSETALEWSPSGIQLLNALVTRALVEIERYADETAGRLLGRLLLEIETVPDEQESVPAYRAAASFALWRGDLVDAARTVELGWSRVRQTQDWFLVARMASTVLEVDAAIVGDARQRRAVATIAAARERAVRVLAEAEAVVRASGVAQSIGSRREADAMLGTARAYLARIEGRDEPAAWDALARGWEALERPYEVARSRWRQAEAALGTSLEAGEGRAGRATARGPLLEAVRIATELGARPLIRELSELAHRALIALPDEAIAAASASGSLARRDGGGAVVAEPLESRVGVGSAIDRGASRRGVAVGPGPSPRSAPGSGRAAPPTNGPGPGPGGPPGSGLAREFVGPAPAPAGDTFGLTAREKEVLAQLAEGRTNREIGERLFISQKTVGVHVGNILAKLGVSGRVEAATVAVRLELTGRR